MIKFEGRGEECVDLLSQLTGVELESITTSNVVLHQGVIPLLLRDPITVFLQLFMNMPPNLPLGKLHF